MSASASSAPRILAPKYNVRMERAVKIPARDGTRLSADLFFPDSPGKFAAIVMYHPYRKDDLGRGGIGEHWYFAQRGFVSVRLDARGTGSSEGINTDEYTVQEHLDGYDVVEWLARQPWSNGSVGMYGISYSGFTSLQVATYRPPHLKAIVPLYATDDRYTDDCHYTPGGNMRMYYDAGTYGNSMIAMNALPPQPELAGAQWSAMWTRRLEHNEPYLLKWMHHQTADDYWRNGSLRPDYSRIQVPVFLIAGWRDGYSNTMLRMFENLRVPKKLLVGPWVHAQPHSSTPGPRIDWINEAARFFAHWLRSEDTGIMEEPAVSVYMQEYTEPRRTLENTPGSWRAEKSLPAAGTRDLTFLLAEHGVLSPAGAPSPVESFDELDHRATTGLANGYWSAGGISFYLPDDQRADEAYSLAYTTPPLQEDLRILGWPKVRLHVSSSAPVATFVAKLADVAPDGHSALIVDGSLNGTRRESLARPAPMKPDAIYDLPIPMMPTGWVLRAGHRLRLSVSTSDFPNLWPTPEPARIRLYHGAGRASSVTLPVAPAAELPAPAFLPPPMLHSVISSFGEPPVQQVLYDQLTGTTTVIRRSGGATVLDDGLGRVKSEAAFRCSASSLDPSKASIVGFHRYTLERENETIDSASETTISATATDFHITINLTVSRNGKPYFQKTWTVTEPRRLL